MKLRRQDDSRITEQAAEWLEMIDHATPQESAAFIDWLKESPRHVGEFLAVCTVSREFEGIDAQRRIDIDALIAQGRSNVVSFDAPGKGRKAVRGARRKVRLAGIAAALVAIAIGTAWSLSTYFGQERFETAVGEQRSVELPDGSVIFLNTRSRLTVHFSQQARDLRLVSGEALFKVARDPKRPFRVDIGTAIVQAVGTQFNIYRRPGATTVSVLEGRIKVSDKRGGGSPGESPASTASLVGGQEASVTADGRVTRMTSVNNANVTAWRQRQLVFSRDRLADVAAEFNRYNQSPRIRIEGDEARERKLTGIFDADDPESLVLFLADSDLKVRQEAGAVIIGSGQP